MSNYIVRNTDKTYIYVVNKKIVNTVNKFELEINFLGYQNINSVSYGSGHVQSLIVNGQDFVSSERDDLHRKIVRHYANGISQEQHYDTMGRLTQQNIVNGHEFGYPSNDQVSQTQCNSRNPAVESMFISVR